PCAVVPRWMPGRRPPLPRRAHPARAGPGSRHGSAARAERGGRQTQADDVVRRVLVLRVTAHPERIAMSFWTRWHRLITLGPKLAKRVRMPKASRRPANRPMTLEFLEARLVPSASVWTDKTDYAPGMTAII